MTFQRSRGGQVALRQFTDAMDAAVAAELSCADLAEEAEQRLHALLSGPGFLTEAERAPKHDCYAQHVVHVHPLGAYSLVSLVWLPDQVTPIHDHRCWCVVGVLEGREHETRYELRQGGSGPTLLRGESTVNEPGDVCRLVPPEENIHQVANAGDHMVVSLHVYGADIARLGTSINQIFDHEVETESTSPGRVLSWRGRQE
ncbi:MAG: hypothetical protein ACRDQA_26765 [Nocardioidaceae bacterium]